MKIIIDFFLTSSNLVKAIELLKGIENWELKNPLFHEPSISNARE